MSRAAQFVFLPHAGGSAADLALFARLICPAAQRHLVELPGRGRRRREALLDEPAAALRDLAAQVTLRLAGGAAPAVFVGHSFGSYLAWLLARWARSRGRAVFVIALSNAPPHLRRDFSAGDEGLLGFVDTVGGVPGTLRGDAVLMERFLGVLRADLAIADGLPKALAAWRDDIPLITAMGERDPVVRDGRRWGEITAGAHSHLVVPGGHFLVQDAPETLAAAIRSSAVFGDWLDGVDT